MINILSTQCNAFDEQRRSASDPSLLIKRERRETHKKRFSLADLIVGRKSIFPFTSIYRAYGHEMSTPLLVELDRIKAIDCYLLFEVVIRAKHRPAEMNQARVQLISGYKEGVKTSIDARRRAHNSALSRKVRRTSVIRRQSRYPHTSMV